MEGIHPSGNSGFVVNISDNSGHRSSVDVIFLPPSITTGDLSQGFKVTDFAVKDEHGNWVNTIESVVFSSPTQEKVFRQIRI